MNKIAFIFDGQGNEFDYFGKDFYHNNSDFKRFIDSYKSSFDIKKYIYDNENKAIDTDLFQPSAFLVELGIAHILRNNNIIAENFAGASLGEYSALSCARFLNVEDGITILKKRGSLMKDALSKINSKMTAIMFLDNQKVEEIAVNNNCEISNDNSYGQVVISGLKEDVEKASDECLKNGARRIVNLDSQGAFHSKYLKDAGTEFKEFLDNYTFGSTVNNNSNVYYNYSGKKEESTDDNIHKLLVKQFYSKVKFLNIIENMINDGIDTFYEIGPGGNLAFHINNIAKENNKNIKIYRISKYKDYVGVL